MSKSSTLDETLRLARERLALFSARLAGEVDAETKERIERQRYARLASREQRTAQREVHDHVVVVRRGTSAFAFPMRHSREIRRVNVTPLPHATPYVLGLFEAHGQIGCLVDLGPFLGLGSSDPAEGGSILAAFLDDGRRVLAVRIDEVVGPRTVFKDECGEHMAVRGHDFVSAVTSDLVSILEIPLLFARPELSIDSAS